MDNTTLINDYAYHLYIKNFKPLEYKGKEVGILVTQEDFIGFLKSLDYFIDYFNNAKLILRKEKIEKILNR